MYDRLKKRLKTEGIPHEDVAVQLGVSRAAVNFRLAGKTPWKLEEAYAVLLMIGEEPDALPKYFPPDGDDRKAGNVRSRMEIGNALKALQTVNEVIAAAVAACE